MYELYKWIDEYVYYYLIITVITYFISYICSSIGEIEIDEKIEFNRYYWKYNLYFNSNFNDRCYITIYSLWNTNRNGE